MEHTEDRKTVVGKSSGRRKEIVSGGIGIGEGWAALRDICPASGAFRFWGLDPITARWANVFRASAAGMMLDSLAVNDGESSSRITPEKQKLNFPSADSRQAALQRLG